MDEIQEKINNNLEALKFLDIGCVAYETVYKETNEMIEKMIIENSI